MARTRPPLAALLVSVVLALGLPPALIAQDYDLLLRGGTVIDGTGAPGFTADVAIRGDRIAAVSTDGIDPTLARDVIDATGLVVTPGFIDNHAHVQQSIARHPLSENFLRQGITTLVASLHSGAQPWPLDDFASSLRTATNVAFFAGHTWTRRRVLGMEDRAPTAAELEQMKELVRTTMRQGALGLSTGLLYVPAAFAETEEVIELARVAAEHGGIYVTHMRDEGTGLLTSIRETIRIADEAGIPAQINHHKAAGAAQWGASVQSLALIDSANAAGLEVTHDIYPYTAASTGSSVLFPAWALAGGDEAFAARVADPATRARLEEEMKVLWVGNRGGRELERVQFRTVDHAPGWNGRTLADYAESRGFARDDFDAGIDLAIELELAGGFSAIYHIMDEDDVVRILRHPLTMVETDGDHVTYGQGYPHPRSYGAFPRVIARYVRELGAITLEEAVRKMTALPADWYGFEGRGRVAEGMHADLAVFDPERIRDLATYTDPHRYSVGIEHLVVNGTPVIRGGNLTGAAPGRWLRGPARPAAEDGAAAAPWIDRTEGLLPATLEWTNKVEIADLDGDGRPDLLFANGGDYSTPGTPEPNRVFLNRLADGQGFIERTDLLGATPDLARVIEARDFDGDGRTDVFVGTTYQTQSRLYLAGADGAMAEVTRSHLPALELSVGDAEAGDVDGDGDLDLVLADWGPGHNMTNAGGRTRLWLNDGAGRFADATQDRMPDVLVGFSWDLELVDVDNDFDLDLLVSCKRCGGSELFRNDGTGRFERDLRGLPAYANNYEFEAMDLDGDGFLDLVTVNDGEIVGGRGSSRREHVFRNDGEGRFRDVTESWWPDAHNIGEDDNVVAFLDADADGDADFVVGSLSGPDRLLVNDGTGRLHALLDAFSGPATPGTLGMSLADLDGDGRMDVVQSQGEHPEAVSERVYLGLGLPRDTVPPVIGEVRIDEGSGRGGRTVVRVRVHDRKSPVVATDWREVVVEWAGGEEGGGGPGQPERAGVGGSPMTWYGEYLWRVEAPAGRRPLAVCATDAAGNRACREVGR